MKALRWHGRQDIRLEEVEFQEELGPGMVEVAVDYCGICGSDLAELQDGPFAIRPGPHRLTGHQPPVTLGHEIAGEVVALGPDAAGVDWSLVDALRKLGGVRIEDDVVVVGPGREPRNLTREQLPA